MGLERDFQRVSVGLGLVMAISALGLVAWQADFGWRQPALMAGFSALGLLLVAKGLKRIWAKRCARKWPFASAFVAVAAHFYVLILAFATGALLHDSGIELYHLAVFWVFPLGFFLYCIVFTFPAFLALWLICGILFWKLSRYHQETI